MVGDGFGDVGVVLCRACGSHLLAAKAVNCVQVLLRPSTVRILEGALAGRDNLARLRVIQKYGSNFKHFGARWTLLSRGVTLLTIVGS